MSASDVRELGSLIATRRKERGLTQPQLARAIGVPDSTIFRLERGEFKEPSPEKLQRIAGALEIDFEDLFATAGYATPEGLPALPVYLRQKFDDLSDEGVERVERYVERLRKDAEKGGRRGKRRR